MPRMVNSGRPEYLDLFVYKRPLGSIQKTVSGQCFKRATHVKLLEDAGPTSVLQQVTSVPFCRSVFSGCNDEMSLAWPHDTERGAGFLHRLDCQTSLGGTEDAI